MSDQDRNPIDDETYGDRSPDDPEAIKQGNPGRPQSELGPFEDEGDAGDGPSTGDADEVSTLSD